MNKILINFAHPAKTRSKINRALRSVVENLENVTLNDLYAAYPDFLIDVEREQNLCEEHDVIIFQHPFYWYSTPAIVKEWMDSQDWLEWIEPKSGVIGAPRLRRGGSTDELCKLLVTKYRTFTVPGSAMEFDGYFRLGFGGEQEELIDGLQQLNNALKEIHS